MSAVGAPRAVWIALGVLLVAFLTIVALAPSSDFFGRVYFDDALYFSTGKALAQGEGFTIPNLPGDPNQTKYPFLFPWLLSLVWRLHPSFPNNVETAALLNGLLGCAFLLASFLYLRRIPGVGDWAALVCVALTAVHTQFLYLAMTPMSEPLFTSLCVSGLLLLELGIEHDRRGQVLLAGVCLGLAFLTRTAGVAFIGAAVIWAAFRRDFRKTGLLLGGATPLVIGHFVWTKLAAVPPAPSSAPLGWVEFWTFSTSYLDFYRMDVPSTDFFVGMLGVNTMLLAMAPAGLAMMQGLDAVGSFAVTIAVVALSVAIVSGILRMARVDGWRSIHLALAFSMGICLLWNGPIQWRILIVFLPLFYAGAWIEGRHILRAVATVFRTNKDIAEKAVASCLAAAVLSVGAWTLYAQGRGLYYLADLPSSLNERFAEFDEAYDWVRSSTNPTEAVLAFADVRMYLETGRKSTYPILISMGNFYPGAESLESRYQRFYDIAEHLDARYLVLGPDDMKRDGEAGTKKRAEVEERFPIAFQTSNKTVTVYDLSSLHLPAQSAAR